MSAPGWATEHGDLVRRPDNHTLLVVRATPGPSSHLWRGVSLRGGRGPVASGCASDEADGIARAEAWYLREVAPVPLPPPDEPGPWDSAELPCRRCYADGRPAAVVERGCSGLAVWTTYTREGAQAGSGALPAGDVPAAERARGVCDAWIARGCPPSSRRVPPSTPPPISPPPWSLAHAPTLPSLPAVSAPPTDGPLLGVAHAIGRLRAVEAGLDELRRQVVETCERLEVVSREQLGGAP